MNDAVWYYAVANEQRGPINEADLAIAIGRGEIGPDSLVWREGMQGWAAARATLPGNLVPQGWVDSLPPSVGAGTAANMGAGGTFGQAGQSETAYGQTHGNMGGYFHPTGFVDVIKTVFNRYVQFSGRARRSEYWYWILFYLIAVLALSLVDAMLFGPGLAEVGVLSNIFALGIFLPSLALTARRLHDIGRSGWWQLIGLVPLIGWVLMIWWLTRPSDPNDNQYGPA